MLAAKMKVNASLSNQLKKLRGKRIKIVYQESTERKPYVSEGKLVDGNPSFIVLKGDDGLVHFIATSKIIRISERFAEKTEFA